MRLGDYPGNSGHSRAPDASGKRPAWRTRPGPVGPHCHLARGTYNLGSSLTRSHSNEFVAEVGNHVYRTADAARVSSEKPNPEHPTPLNLGDASYPYPH